MVGYLHRQTEEGTESFGYVVTCIIIFSKEITCFHTKNECYHTKSLYSIEIPVFQCLSSYTQAPPPTLEAMQSRIQQLGILSEGTMKLVAFNLPCILHV